MIYFSTTQLVQPHYLMKFGRDFCRIEIAKLVSMLFGDHQLGANINEHGHAVRWGSEMAVSDEQN